MNLARACRLLGLVGLVGFLTSVFTPVPNLLSRSLGTSARLEPAQAVVVLGGGGVRADGTLSNTSLRRAFYGIALYRKGLAPRLVFSGPAGPHGMVEAEVRAALARELSVPPDAILTEGTGQTTREEGARLGALLRGRSIRRILLVTDWEGMARAQRVFVRQGLEVLPAPVDDVPALTDTPEGRLELTRRVLGELLAGLYYRVAGYL